MFPFLLGVLVGGTLGFAFVLIALFLKARSAVKRRKEDRAKAEEK